MSKIVKNTKLSSYSVDDIGVVIPASSQYVVPSQDYWKWAASSDVITGIGSGDLVINDGSSDLSIALGVDLIKHVLPGQMQLLGCDGCTIADIVLESGVRKLQTKSTISVDELLGEDQYPSAWFKITNAVASTTITLNIGSHGPWSIPVSSTDLNTAAQDAVDWLNTQTSPDFKNNFTARKVLDNPIVHIESDVWAEYGEESSFSSSGNGGTTTTDGFSDFKRRKKLISLSFDERDPRVGIMGVSGSVRTYQKNFKDIFVDNGKNGSSCDMCVNGSSTPVEFKIENTSTEKDLIIEEVRLIGEDGNLVFSKFFDIAALTNGVKFEVKSEGEVTTFPLMKTSQCIITTFCRGGINFLGYLNKNGVFVFKPTGPILLKKSGTYGSGNEDYIKFIIQDDLTGLISFQYSAAGYYEG